MKAPQPVRQASSSRLSWQGTWDLSTIHTPLYAGSRSRKNRRLLLNPRERDSVPHFGISLRFPSMRLENTLVGGETLATNCSNPRSRCMSFQLARCLASQLLSTPIISESFTVRMEMVMATESYHNPSQIIRCSGLHTLCLASFTLSSAIMFWRVDRARSAQCNDASAPPKLSRYALEIYPLRRCIQTIPSAVLCMHKLDVRSQNGGHRSK